MDERDISIIHEKEYYAVYINGTFYCSADTFSEALYEAERYLENHT